MGEITRTKARNGLRKTKIAERSRGIFTFVVWRDPSLLSSTRPQKLDNKRFTAISFTLR